MKPKEPCLLRSAFAGLYVSAVEWAAGGTNALASDASFQMVTGPAPTGPRIEVVSGTGLPCRLRFNAETNRFHHLLSTTNLAQTVWEELPVTNATSTAVEFTDLASSAAQRTYYRVRVGKWLGLSCTPSYLCTTNPHRS